MKNNGHYESGKVSERIRLRLSLKRQLGIGACERFKLIEGQLSADRSRQ